MKLGMLPQETVSTCANEKLPAPTGLPTHPRARTLAQATSSSGWHRQPATTNQPHPAKHPHPNNKQYPPSTPPPAPACPRRLPHSPACYLPCDYFGSSL